MATLDKIITHPTPHTAWDILCDFDGTISFKDVTDTLLETFGMHGWEALEERWESGEIGSRECMSGQIALLDASRSELDACLDSLEIDPAFGDFIQFTQANHVPLYIVSDGLDYAIQRILHANEIHDVPVIANHLRQVSERRWEITFPHHTTHCQAASGTCKCAVANTIRRDNILLIGDGRSDFCVSRNADYTFAKKSLIDECRRLQNPFSPVHNFQEAQQYLTELLAHTQAHSGKQAG